MWSSRLFFAQVSAPSEYMTDCRFHFVVEIHLIRTGGSDPGSVLGVLISTSYYAVLCSAWRICESIIKMICGSRPKGWIPILLCMVKMSSSRSSVEGIPWKCPNSSVCSLQCMAVVWKCSLIFSWIAIQTINKLKWKLDPKKNPLLIQLPHCWAGTTHSTAILRVRTYCTTESPVFCVWQWFCR